MALPGETEAGFAGTQPCRGIAWWAHRDAAAAGEPLAMCVSSRNTAAERKTPCLENSCPIGAEPSLTEAATSPFQAEPAQLN
jgi:hypothetical protein